jgi:hypothetical protein
VRDVSSREVLVRIVETLDLEDADVRASDPRRSRHGLSQVLELVAAPRPSAPQTTAASGPIRGASSRAANERKPKIRRQLRGVASARSERELELAPAA